MNADRFTIAFDHRRNPVIVDGVTGERVVKPFATAERCRTLVDEMNAKAGERIIRNRNVGVRT